MTSPFTLSSYYKKAFSGITLAGDVLKNKEFEECRFEKMSLTDCQLNQCKFINCTFDNSILSAIKPVNSSFSEIKFMDSKVIGFDWTLAKRVDSLSFTNSQINYSNFRFLKLQKLKLINCIAKEADFTEADLKDSDFSGTDFEGARFFKTNLKGSNFKKAKNYFIDIKTNTITKAQFSFPEAINLLKSLAITIVY